MSSAQHRDAAGAKLGMWLFLFTELILFGGLFLLFAVALSRFPGFFATASRELDLAYGTANTVILLTSSLTVALALTAVQRGLRTPTLILLGSTVLLALLFLVNKGFEWSEKIAHGLYPGSSQLAARAPGEVAFYNLYYLTAGLHAVHVLVGALALAVVAILVARGQIHGQNFVVLENAGLYWHLVDIVWIFLFPLYYLIL